MNGAYAMTMTTAPRPVAPQLSTVMLWSARVVAWIFQYTVAVWCILTWRAIMFGVKSGGALLLLVFLPVVGWIILAIILVMRCNREPSTRRSVWHPWLT